MLCLAISYLCIEFDFSYNLNITLFSIAIIFPLVFTIREAFKRRDAVIKLLSIFKSSLNSVYYCFENNNKLSDENKHLIADKLNGISQIFFKTLQGGEYNSQAVRNKLNEVFEFVRANRKSISTGVSLKIIRFLKDVDESIENTMGIKMHGTPVSLRAYCLVFIYIFPFVFIPTLIRDMGEGSLWLVYVLSITHGFILISLYNVQERMENPFDQIGLDDIKLEEFYFQKAESLSPIPDSQREAAAIDSEN